MQDTRTGFAADVSKYRDHGAYHFAAFYDPTSTYRRHALSVLAEMLHFSHPIRSVLDLGAGEGLFCRLLEQRGVGVFGWEIDPDALRLSAERACNVVERDLTVVPWNVVGVDLVLALDVLEHIPEALRQDVLTEMARTAPCAFIAIPDRQDKHACGAMPTCEAIEVTMAEYGMRLIAKDQRHARHVLLFER